MRLDLAGGRCSRSKSYKRKGKARKGEEGMGKEFNSMVLVRLEEWNGQEGLE